MTPKILRTQEDAAQHGQGEPAIFEVSAVTAEKILLLISSHETPTNSKRRKRVAALLTAALAAV